MKLWYLLKVSLDKQAFAPLSNNDAARTHNNLELAQAKLPAVSHYTTDQKLV